MTLGALLKQARLEAGLSQRQLCGDTITRNMLSQIENGTARPSMDVLRTLAGRLGKPVSFFLEENVVVSANQTVMERARAAFDCGEYEETNKELAAYQQPDPVFDPEKGLLEALCCLELAQRALEQGKNVYAAKLLTACAGAGALTPYYGAELERRRLLLLAKAQPDQTRQVAAMLPSLDEELRLRGRSALLVGDPARAAALLDSAEDHADVDWCLLRGEAAYGLGAFREAADYFHMAEKASSEKAGRWLEQCYRELEDYKMAYYYACRQKEGNLK